MPILPLISPKGATGEVAEMYREHGPAPIIQCFSLRPDFGKLIAAAADVVHFKDGFLTRRDHEAIATYVSGLNHCPF